MDVNLVLCKKSGRSKAFPLPSTVTVVGRRQDCDLCIPLNIVSRRHCEFNLDEGSLSVRDLESRNGTFVNGEQISDEKILKAGDRVQIGPLNFIAQIDGNPAEITPDMIPDSQDLGQTTIDEKQFVNHAEQAKAQQAQTEEADEDIDFDDLDLPDDQNSTEILDLSDNDLI